MKKILRAMLGGLGLSMVLVALLSKIEKAMQGTSQSEARQLEISFLHDLPLHTTHGEL